MKRILVGFGVAFLACGFVSAQEQKQMAERKALEWRTADEARMQEAGVMFGQVIKGAPFSAQRTEESTQTLGDGTHINNKSSVSYVRDSAGRVRREDNEWITIYDPIANVSYRLNKKNHAGSKVELLHGEAAKIKLDQIDQAEADYLKVQAERSLAEKKSEQDSLVVITNEGPNGGAYSVRKRGTQESLGSQVVNGVMADGTRTTSTIPEGDFGNDRPIQIVVESWYSPELHLTVLFKRSDPRDGEVVTQYSNIQRTEPNPLLFQVPAGSYTLNQEKWRQEEIR